MPRNIKIPEIKDDERYVIDFSNIKDGLIKYQDSFADKKKALEISKSIYKGMPILLPVKNKVFCNTKEEFSINRKVILNFFFSCNENYKPFKKYISTGNRYCLPKYPKKK